METVPASPHRTPGGTSGTTRELRHYLGVLRKRWRVMTALLILTLAGVFVWTVRQPRIFQATCSIVIESTAPQVLQGVKDVVEMGPGWASYDFYETQFRIIQSRDMAERVIDRLALGHDPAFGLSADGVPGLARQNLVNRLLGQIRVVAVKQSRIANISVMDTDPERATKIANAFADTYIERNLDYKLEGAHSAGTWLAEQTVGLRKQLETAEMDLYKFRKEHNLLDVGLDDRQGMNRQNVQTINSKLADIKAKRIEMESIRRLIVAAKSDVTERESLPEIRDNQVVQKLRENYLDLLKTRADLESRYGEKHPRIENIEKQIEAVQRDYGRELDNVLKAFDKRYQAIVDTETSLAKWMQQEKQLALDLSKVETQYRPLARDAENDAKVYGLVSERHKEIDLTGVLRANNVRILDRALPPTWPVSPRLGFNLTVAFVIGLLLSLLAAFVVEALDNTVKTAEAAESLLGAPVLGHLPMLSLVKGRTMEDAPERDLTVFNEPTSIAAEACRSIRTNLMFLSAEKEVAVLVVTSPGPRDGKTTAAISLAITMAQGGARVLLVDTDMRKPRIHRSFGIKSERGVSTVILGDASLKDVVFHSEIPNLDVMPCGPTPPNPAELLHTDRFREFLAQCRRDHDRVVLDSPPMAPVTDPAILGNLADGVVLVLRAGHTTREAASYAGRQLADARARILGLVINQTDRRGSGYGYSYYAPYGRYYRTA
ncbi:MAG: polysaccharide biosynthesis tyrosine autokinase [Polyangia bacterium]|jgi:capsular exopolysaccharide synthesis family protein